MAVDFILNNVDISTDVPSGETLLDFIRYHQHLTGTKIGCREGDCGACTILIGEVIDDKVIYKSMTSCITPLGNADGRHIVTIEGLNMNILTPVQQSMVDCSGSQCGFCTPGFVVSMTNNCMTSDPVSKDSFVQSIDGNICRCTGYFPMMRIADIMTNKLKNKNLENPIKWAIKNNFIPNYFSTIKERLNKIKKNIPIINSSNQIVGGGTDLYVQRHDDMPNVAIEHILNMPSLKGIKKKNGQCIIGGATTASELLQNELLDTIFPKLKSHLLLVSSTPIRNMGTIAGNLVNASPIGDLTAFFLALDSQLLITSDNNERTIYLKDFYKGYKDIDKAPDEVIHSIIFNIPESHAYFNFEKVSKRTYLDIASVNSAMKIDVSDNVIRDIHISVGGVGPIPKYLYKTKDYLSNKNLSPNNIIESINILQEEISPISDARGSETYKRLLSRQLFFSHFIELFPSIFSINNLSYRK